MQRFAFVVAFGAVSAILAACSSSESSTPNRAPDASIGADAGTQDTTDGGAGTDAGPTGPELGEPITATPGTWTFVPFPDSACANGSATGIGINPGTSKRLVVYLEGGGACWDEGTCYTQKFAANLDGWDETKFKARVAEGVGKSHLDRTTANNPFKDASYVYIPYCTGDVHAGDKEQTYGTHVTKHFGRKNLEAYLKRITPTFKDAERVVLTGSSAGGFGAALNYWRFKKYFASTRVDLVDDSGPPFPTDKMAYFSSWLAAWDLQGGVAPDCADCANGNISAVLPFYSKTYPEARFSLLSYDHDFTISLFFGLSEDEFAAALADVTTKSIDPLSNMKAFEVKGTNHTMLGDLTTTSNGKDLGSWLTEMESDAATWTTVRP